MTTVMVAYYFSLVMPAMPMGPPIVVGPFESWGACASVREYVDRRFGAETAGCALLPFPQPEAVELRVGELPPLYGTRPPWGRQEERG